MLHMMPAAIQQESACAIIMTFDPGVTRIASPTALPSTSLSYVVNLPVQWEDDETNLTEEPARTIPGLALRSAHLQGTGSLWGIGPAPQVP